MRHSAWSDAANWKDLMAYARRSLETPTLQTALLQCNQLLTVDFHTETWIGGDR